MGYRSLDKTISTLEMELAEARTSQSSGGVELPLMERASNHTLRKAFIVIGINTAFSSRKRRDSVRETWMPRGRRSLSPSHYFLFFFSNFWLINVSQKYKLQERNWRHWRKRKGLLYGLWSDTAPRREGLLIEQSTQKRLSTRISSGSNMSRVTMSSPPRPGCIFPPPSPSGTPISMWRWTTTSM